MKCTTPVILRNIPDVSSAVVPCRQCFACSLNRRREWTGRLVLEGRCHNKGLWVTLTYNNKHLPTQYICPNTGQFFHNKDGCLDPTHLKNFIKRIRKRLPPKTLRYYSVGEYGSKNHRPHYHVCLFGIGHHQKHLVLEAWSSPYSKGRDSYGNVDFGKIEPHSAQYTAGYTVKKMTKTTDPRLGGAYPENARFSQGIGRGFVSNLKKAVASLDMDYLLNFPRVFKVSGKLYPFGKYIWYKLLKELGVYREYKKASLSRFQQEMYSLQSLAKSVKEKTMSLTPWILVEMGYFKRYAVSLFKEDMLMKKILENGAKYESI